MTVQWRTPCLQWAAGEKMCHLPQAAELLDPARKGTLAYRPMARAALEPLLAEQGLWKPAPSKDWVNGEILDRLYDAVAQAGEGAIPVMPTLTPMTMIGAPASAAAPPRFVPVMKPHGSKVSPAM